MTMPDFERAVLVACVDEWQRQAQSAEEYAWVTVEALARDVPRDEGTAAQRNGAIRAAMTALMGGRRVPRGGPRLEVVGVRRRGGARVADVAWRLRPNGSHANGAEAAVRC